MSGFKIQSSAEDSFVYRLFLFSLLKNIHGDEYNFGIQRDMNYDITRGMQLKILASSNFFFFSFFETIHTVMTHSK
jgi:hypothetical protein